MQTPFRPRAVVVALAATAALAVAGCGSSGSSSSSTNASASAPPRGGPFAQLTTSQRACLSKAGVTLPTGPRNGGKPPSGGPPPGGAPGGRPPAGGRPGGRRGSSKFRAALQKCGVQLPRGGPSGAGAPPQASSSES